ncbi:MAG: hypothetical protein J0H12_00065, partial [Candidatus Paracaedimonas acanthamoebae]|nr:hypothetical protein [Candidatus Paracaedimonas acanthamoebae]
DIKIRDGVALAKTCKQLGNVINTPSIWENYAKRIPGTHRYLQLSHKEGEDPKASPQKTASFYKNLLKRAMSPEILCLHDLDAEYPAPISGNSLTVIGTYIEDNSENQGHDETYIYTSIRVSNGWQTYLSHRADLEDCLIVHAIDASGSLSVGSQGGVAIEYGQSRAFILTKGTEEVRYLKNTVEHVENVNYEFSKANDIAASPERTIIVGAARDPHVPNFHLRAAQWILTGQDESVQFLGTINNGKTSHALAISLNQSTIVGISDDGADDNKRKAFIWTETDGMRSLGTLKGDMTSEAIAVSADGNIVLGTSFKTFHLKNNFSPNARAFIWRRASPEVLQKAHELSFHVSAGGVMHPLKIPSRYINGVASAMSADGRRIVGYCGDLQNTKKAFMWDINIGSYPIESVFRHFLPQGTTLNEAISISKDGTTMIINGQISPAEDDDRLTVFYAFIPRFDAAAAQGINLTKRVPAAQSSNG